MMNRIYTTVNSIFKGLCNDLLSKEKGIKVFDSEELIGTSVLNTRFRYKPVDQVTVESEDLSLKSLAKIKFKKIVSELIDYYKGLVQINEKAWFCRTLEKDNKRFTVMSYFKNGKIVIDCSYKVDELVIKGDGAFAALLINQITSDAFSMVKDLATALEVDVRLIDFNGVVFNFDRVILDKGSEALMSKLDE